MRLLFYIILITAIVVVSLSLYQQGEKRIIYGDQETQTHTNGPSEASGYGNDADYLAPYLRGPTPDCGGTNSLGTPYQKLSGMRYMQILRSRKGNDGPPLFLVAFRSRTGNGIVIYMGGLPDDPPFVFRMIEGHTYSFCALPLSEKEQMYENVGASFIATARTIKDEANDGGR